MSDESPAPGAPEAAGGHEGHHEIHVPPNSWIPICLAATITMTLVGFLISPVVWGLGLLLTIALLVAWYRSARKEFEELPD